MYSLNVGLPIKELGEKKSLYNMHKSDYFLEPWYICKLFKVHLLLSTGWHF